VVGRALLLAGTALAVPAGSALADPQYWDGSLTTPNGVAGGAGGDGVWYASGGGNFTNAGGTANADWAGGDAVFAGSAGTVQVNGAVNFTSAHFTVTGYDVRQDETAFISSLVTAPGGGTVTTDSGVTTTVSVVIDGSSGGALIKDGAGTLILQDNPFGGANTQSSTLINGGTLQVTSAAVLGQDNGAGLSVTISNGATLNYHDPFLSNPALSDGLSTTFTGAVILGAGGGVIEVDDASNRPGDSNAATLILQGGVSGTGGLTKTGTGTLALYAASTYAGATNVQAGALDLYAAGALGGGDLTIGSGAMARAYVGDVSVQTLNGAGAFYFASSGAQSLTVGGGAFSGLIGELNGATGALIKTGAGTLTLSGANAYSGGTSVTGGTLALANNSGAGSGAIALAGGTTLQLANVAVANAITLTGAANLDPGAGTSTLSGAISGAGGFAKLGAGTLVLTGANAYSGTTTIGAGVLQIGAGGASGSLGSGAVIDNASLVFDRSNSVTVAQIISGTGALTQAGAGTLTLTGANAYSGGTTIAAGEIVAGNSTALGTGAVSMANGATLGFSSSMALANALAVSGSTGGVLDTGSNAVIWSGVVSGAGALTKTGAGTLTLTGANAYSGGTYVDSGALALAGAQALGSGSLDLADATTLELLSSMTLSNRVVFSGAGDPNIDTGASTVTLTGAISGSGALTKLGTGTLVLTGADTFSGATTVAQGTLEVDGSIVSSTTVQSGAALSGVGTVGAIAVSSGGTLAPGNAAQPYGTLRATGAVAFASGSTYAVSFGPTGSSLLTATGSASLAGAVAATWTGGAATAGSRYTILTASGGVSGVFGGLTVTGLTGNLPVLAYDSNDVYLVFNGLASAAVTSSFNRLAGDRIGALITHGVLAGVLDGVNEQINCDNCVSTFGSVGSLSAGMHGRLTLSDNFALLGGAAYSQYHSGGVAVTSAPIFLGALRYDKTEWGASRPFAEIGASASPWQRAGFRRSYDDAGVANSGTGAADLATYSAFGKLGWIVRWSPIDEVAAWGGLSRSWQIVGGYVEGGANNASPATVAGGTDMLNVGRIGAQWTHLFGAAIETQISLAAAQSFDARSGLSGDVLGLSGIHASLGDYRWAEYGLRVGYRFADNAVVDLFADGTLGGRPVGDTIHGGAGLRWAF
jgi:autotransporter-associated beta strand protein